MSQQSGSSLNQLPRRNHSQIIKDILDAYNKEGSDLKDIRIAALCSLAFAGFFRFNELCNIAPNRISHFVPRSKTDVYREGNYVYISASESQYCPVSVLRKYMNLAGIHDNSNLPLFRPLVFHKSNSSYTLRDGKMSYSSCRERIP